MPGKVEFPEPGLEHKAFITEVCQTALTFVVRAKATHVSETTFPACRGSCSSSSLEKGLPRWLTDSTLHLEMEYSGAEPALSLTDLSDFLSR